MSFLDNLFATGIAAALKTPTGSIDVSASTPVVDYVLKVQDAEHAIWAPGGVGPAGPAGPDGPAGDDGPTGPQGPRGLSTDLFLTPQASPDAWDLNASVMTDPDLANNGWTVALRDSPWTVLTRAGDIDRALGNAVAGTYRSTLLGGVLILQLPSAGQVQIYKATSGAFTYKSSMYCGEFASANAAYVFVSSGVQFGSGVANEFYFGGLENTSVVAVRWVGPGSGTYSVESGGGASMGAISEVKRKMVCYLDHNPSVLTRFFAITQEGLIVTTVRTTGLAVAPAVYAGAWLTHSANRWAFINFIRRTPLNQFP